MSAKLPVVSIVGRQNVGKSTLFNALIKDKKSIVDSFPGLTRDIISSNVTHKDQSFILSDTPGLDLSSSSELSDQIIEGARSHLEKSSLILFLMEDPGPDGFDMDLANILRKLAVPTVIAVNKMDSHERMENMVNFYEMGFNEIIPISAKRKTNVNMLLDRITDLLPRNKSELKEADLRIAIVGRPNSGKSTLLNAFMGYERSVVSDIPGTTRDSVDDTFPFDGKIVQVIDTAGIRKKSKMTESIEYYSFTRTVESINRCDVAIHMIDATVGLTDNDKKISDEILKSKKPIIIAINKWDAIEKDHKTFKEYKDKLIFRYYRAADFPIISISARDKQRINKILQTAVELDEKARRRIETPKLNRVVAELQSKGRIPQLGEKIRIYYAAQIDTVPPQFKFFVNNPDFFRKDIVRYFEKSIQEIFDLQGLPIIIHIEGKKNRKEGKEKREAKPRSRGTQKKDSKGKKGKKS